MRALENLQSGLAGADPYLGAIMFYWVSCLFPYFLHLQSRFAGADRYPGAAISPWIVYVFLYNLLLQSDLTGADPHPGGFFRLWISCLCRGLQGLIFTRAWILSCGFLLHFRTLCLSRDAMQELILIRAQRGSFLMDFLCMSTLSASPECVCGEWPEYPGAPISYGFPMYFHTFYLSRVGLR